MISSEKKRDNEEFYIKFYQNCATNNTLLFFLYLKMFLNCDYYFGSMNNKCATPHSFKAWFKSKNPFL